MLQCVEEAHSRADEDGPVLRPQRLQLRDERAEVMLKIFGGATPPLRARRISEQFHQREAHTLGDPIQRADAWTSNAPHRDALELPPRHASSGGDGGLLSERTDGGANPE